MLSRLGCKVCSTYFAMAKYDVTLIHTGLLEDLKNKEFTTFFCAAAAQDRKTVLRGEADSVMLTGGNAVRRRHHSRFSS